MYTNEQCYKILSVDHDCNWSTLRKSYKQLIQKWHPDKFSEETKKLAAEDKIKELNAAFIQLSNFYKKYGILPFAAQAEANLETSSPKPRKSASTKPTESKVTSPESVVSSLSTEPNSKNNNKYFFITLAASFITFLYFNSEYIPTANNIEEGQQDYSDESNNIILINSDGTKIPELTQNQDLPLNEKLSDEIPDEIPHVPESYYFTYGSSIGEVLSIQGRPDSIDGDLWFYGSSYVKFKDGVVEDWKRSSEFPLKAHINL